MKTAKAAVEMPKDADRYRIHPRLARGVTLFYEFEEVFFGNQQGERA